MNQKEIGEIRRRIRRDRSNMTAIYGCYVNAQNEIIAEFKQPGFAEKLLEDIKNF